MSDPAETPTRPPIGSKDIRDLGRQLVVAEKSAQPIPPLSDLYEISVGNAYAIQKRYAELRVEAGATVVGHKIGCTSQAIQNLFNIDTPDYGHLFDDMLVGESDPIEVDDLIQPLTEPEMAFVLAETLSGPGVTAEDVVAASRGVVPCLEIIDSRIRDWKIRLADTIADNGSSARFVVGTEVVPINGLDLAAEQVLLTRNGKEVGRGLGSAALGHPARSAAWLANALGEFGESIPAGSYVLSGSLTTAIPARTRDRFRAEFSNIGVVSCWFSGDQKEGD